MGLSTCTSTEKEVHTDSIDYKIGQRIAILQLIRGYTREDLAKKIGVTPQEVHDYKQGYTAIPLDKLYEIANALSVKVRALLPEIKKDGRNESEHNKTDDQELWSRFSELIRTLSKSMKVVKEKVKRAEKVKIANNLLRLGISTHVISRTTGVPAETTR